MPAALQASDKLFPLHISTEAAAKNASQSAISDFDEYTMIKPREFGGYVGFTESEVKSICEKSDVDFEQMKLWYDGYSFKNVGSVYNPNSVMKAARNNDFDSYWTETSAA